MTLASAFPSRLSYQKIRIYPYWERNATTSSVFSVFSGWTLPIDGELRRLWSVPIVFAATMVLLLMPPRA
jgi:hypothetical protein